MTNKHDELLPDADRALEIATLLRAIGGYFDAAALEQVPCREVADLLERLASHPTPQADEVRERNEGEAVPVAELGNELNLDDLKETVAEFEGGKFVELHYNGHLAFGFLVTQMADGDSKRPLVDEIVARLNTSPPSAEHPRGADEVKRLEEVTRVEVIDINGRAYSNWNPGNKVELSFQDSGKTLKVFITNVALSHKEEAE